MTATPDTTGFITFTDIGGCLWNAVGLYDGHDTNPDPYCEVILMPEDAPRDDRYLLLTLAQALRLAHRIVDIATQYQRDLERAAERRRFNDECRAEGAKGQVPRPDSRRPAGATQPTLPAPLKHQAAGPL